MKNCPKCNAQIRDTAKFCIKCGCNIIKYEEQSEKTYFCPECGTQFSGGKFCPECGTNIIDYCCAENAVASEQKSVDFSDLSYLVAQEASKKREEEARLRAEKERLARERAEREAEIKRDFEIIGTVLHKYKGNGGSVIIPDSVTSIGDYAFYDCKSLTSITIPNSVTSIGDCAFSNCERLTSITIPNSATFIGDSAFFNCERLTSITIPNSVTSIGDFAFARSGLTSVTVPNSVINIHTFAFLCCDNLKSISLPKHLGNLSFDVPSTCKIVIRQN